MVENNGLPINLSSIGDGQHTVLDVVIWERPSNEFGAFARPPAVIDRMYNYELVAIFVILGTHSGQNPNIPPYYRISPDNLTGILSLFDIEEGKTIVTVKGKIIEIFNHFYR